MNTKENSIVISQTDQGREFWLNQKLAQDYADSVAAADVLLVPLKDFREGVRFVFHQDTQSFARYLARELSGKAAVEVLANDDEYVEIALHGAVTRIGTIVVSFVLAPIVMNIVSNYIYDAIKAKPTDNVEMTIVVEDHECHSLKFSFKGEARDFGLLTDKVGEMARNCEAAKNTHKKHFSAHRLDSEQHAGSIHISQDTNLPTQSEIPTNIAPGTLVNADSRENT